jgi:hypothetical protein
MSGRARSMTLNGKGDRIRACVVKAHVARQRANDLEVTATQELNEAEVLCQSNGLSFKYWVKRNTGLTYKEAKWLCEKVRWRQLGWRVHGEDE